MSRYKSSSSPYVQMQGSSRVESSQLSHLAYKFNAKPTSPTFDRLIPTLQPIKLSPSSTSLKEYRNSSFEPTNLLSLTEEDKSISDNPAHTDTTTETNSLLEDGLIKRKIRRGNRRSLSEGNNLLEQAQSYLYSFNPKARAVAAETEGNITGPGAATIPTITINLTNKTIPTPISTTPSNPSRTRSPSSLSPILTNTPPSLTPINPSQFLSNRRRSLTSKLRRRAGSDSSIWLDAAWMSQLKADEVEMRKQEKEKETREETVQESIETNSTATLEEDGVSAGMEESPVVPTSPQQFSFIKSPTISPAPIIALESKTETNPNPLFPSAQALDHAIALWTESQRVYRQQKQVIKWHPSTVCFSVKEAHEEIVEEGDEEREKEEWQQICDHQDITSGFHYISSHSKPRRSSIPPSLPSSSNNPNKPSSKHTHPTFSLPPLQSLLTPSFLQLTRGQHIQKPSFLSSPTRFVILSMHDYSLSYDWKSISLLNLIRIVRHGDTRLYLHINKHYKTEYNSKSDHSNKEIIKEKILKFELKQNSLREEWYLNFHIIQSYLQALEESTDPTLANSLYLTSYLPATFLQIAQNGLTMYKFSNSQKIKGKMLRFTNIQLKTQTIQWSKEIPTPQQLKSKNHSNTSTHSIFLLNVSYVTITAKNPLLFTVHDNTTGQKLALEVREEDGGEWMKNIWVRGLRDLIDVLKETKKEEMKKSNSSASNSKNRSISNSGGTSEVVEAECEESKKINNNSLINNYELRKGNFYQEQKSKKEKRMSNSLSISNNDNSSVSSVTSTSACSYNDSSLSFSIGSTEEELYSEFDNLKTRPRSGEILH